MLRSLFLLAFLLLPTIAVADLRKEGIDFLAENAKQPDVVTLPSGLQYKVLNKGAGKHHPAPDSDCLCHYEGRLISGKVFDSSYERGEPATFSPDAVIKGWTEAMQMMVEGDKWEMYIPSDLAYGDDGAGGDIPGGATLIFVMELQEIKGEKVPALTCDVVSGGDCSPKERKYINKMKIKPIPDLEKELDRLNGMMEQKMTADLQDWIKRRVYILSLLIKLVERAAEIPEL